MASPQAFRASHDEDVETDYEGSAQDSKTKQDRAADLIDIVYALASAMDRLVSRSARLGLVRGRINSHGHDAGSLADNGSTIGEPALF